MTNKEKFLEAQLEYQKRLNAITTKIHAANDTNEILLNLQNDILSLFDAERITVYAVDAKNREIFSMMKTGEEIKEIRVPINKDSISGCCAATCKLIEIENAYNDRELENLSPKLRFNKSWDQKTGFRTKPVLAAPILYNRYILGVIQLINKTDGGRFTQNDQISALEIGKVLGAAFFKNKKVEERRKSTKFDFLIDNNIISTSDLASAMAAARNSKRDMADVLMKDYRVPKEDIGKALSHYYNARFIPFQDKMVIPGQLLKGLKVNYLVSSSFVPVAEEDDKVIIAMADP
ncbi:MAG: GAF domain-containing protein, partial [Deltaproteobacteria bacterium]|nr:GAF domain-containing protein [Deltaproteobacteria bacterium]